MNVYSLPKFSPPARKLWTQIPKEQQARLIHNVWCASCRGETTMINFTGKVVSGNLVLEGACQRCKGPVARFVEQGN